MDTLNLLQDLMKIIFFIPLLTIILLATGCQTDSSPVQTKIVRINATDDPTNLDPRIVRDLPTVTTLHLLYEGLARAGQNGELTLALAEKVDISDDLTQYTFHLRDAHWSNGDSITAHDFERSWKSLLDPQFPAPNAYQFYVIKGAQEAKEGKHSLDNIGIKALSDKTLVVSLVSPTPYFLELTSFHPFFPVHAEWDKLSASEKGSPDKHISSGPFILKTWAHHNSVGFEKNPNYMNAADVKINGIQLIVANENTALQMFEAGELDWTGSPLSTIPPDAVQGLKQAGALEIAPAAGTYWFRFNTEKTPFNNSKIRKALSYAIDRQAIADHILQGGQTPAMGIIPPTMKLQDLPYFNDNDSANARRLLEEGLQEAGLTKEELPRIALSYTQSDRNHKIAQAVQQQWKKALNLDIVLESYETKVYYDKLSRQDYQINIGSWFADIRDPSNFLDVFKSKANSTNNTLWEHPEYIRLLGEAAISKEIGQRKDLLNKAEAILMDEMPIAPLFYTSFNFVKKLPIKGVYFSELGYLDFSQASIEE